MLRSPVSTFWREVRAAAGSARYLILALAMPPAVYVLYTAGGAGVSDRLIAGTTWATHFMVSMAAFAVMGAAVSVAAARRRPPTRLREGILVRLAAAMLLVLPAICLVCATAAAVHGVSLPIGSWLRLLVVLWLGAVPFVALGLVLGAIFDRDTPAIAVLGIVVVLAVLGGLFQPVEAMPGSTTAIAHVVPSFHLAALGWTAIAGRGPHPADVVALAGYAVVLGAMLRWRGGDETTRADG